MPVWRAQPVQEQSALTLRSWQVVQLPNGERHLVGYCIENKEGRTSSVLRQIDVRTLNVTTRSGRTYVLDGPPGHNPDADYVWKRWTVLNAVRSWEDASASVWQCHLDAQQQ